MDGTIKYEWKASKPKICCDPQSNNAKQILATDTTWDIVESPVGANIIWARKHYPNIQSQLKPFQALNYLPTEEIITTKGNLTKKLQAYHNTNNTLTHRDFYQETYCLYDPKERFAFLDQLPSQDKPDNIWILKPSILSQGEGIKIVWQFDKLKQEWRDPTKNTLECNGKQREYIIQRYIKNVLLLEGKKSEIRIYWLIASLDPLLVLMYNGGTARLTSQPYKLDEFDNPLIHITNIYQQKKHGIEDTNAELKWNFKRLQSYLSQEKSASPTFIEQELKPKLKECLAYVVRASIDDLKQTPPSGMFFGLYGADFILDDSLTPWLTEIQRGPGLSYDDPIKQQLIPPMLLEAVHIILEIQARKQHLEPLSNLSSIKNFEWVIR